MKLDLDALKRLCKTATPGPWSWCHVGEKTNGYVVGAGYDSKGNALSGFTEDEYAIPDEILQRFRLVGDHEESAVNYEDAAFIVAARDALPQLIELVPELKEAVRLADNVIRRYDVVFHAARPISGLVQVRKEIEDYRAHREKMEDTNAD